MTRMRRKKGFTKSKHLQKARWTSKRTKDQDQIHEDLKPENAEKIKHQKRDDGLPGLGQFYCIHCARYFINQEHLDKHIASKLHRRRAKQAEAEPYTQRDAEAAAGMGAPEKVI
eukprot:GILK01009139.1.p1 GENE.GILK01009139.1~~GILK01009139.1.p1  ORF type:complete len:114 (+),score=18.74 GILK01009139.1:43-384(+)